MHLSDFTRVRVFTFQWAPTLGGECYDLFYELHLLQGEHYTRFNGHPPLGVNATSGAAGACGEAPPRRFNGHPPLGVNATV